MTYLRRSFVILTLMVALTFGSARADTIETTAKQAYLVDLQTGNVLMEKNSDETMVPSSMSKMMTLYMVFEKLKEGTLSLEEKLLVSEKAWRMGGSKMFVEVGDEIAVQDLIRGIAVQSGNDACIVFAEALAGTEEAFADQMTDHARKLGMNGTTFKNSSGWPDPEHVTTARDLAILAEHTIREFPEYYKFYSEKEFTFSEIKQGNRNPLLYGFEGGDGIKTGHTEAGGYGLVGSAIRDGRRLVLVINGLESRQDRISESKRLLAWGFREFENISLFKSGDIVETAEVWFGMSETVALTLEEDITATVRRADREGLSVKVVYEGPIPAPINKGQPIATLVVQTPGGRPLTYPLKAAEAIPRLGFFGRILAAVEYLVLGSEG
ncbi:MAG: D-alanyl-D-alanine carboxypeptidase family protein [Magnetospiraceae bacterium]